MELSARRRIGALFIYVALALAVVLAAALPALPAGADHGIPEPVVQSERSALVATSSLVAQPALGAKALASAVSAVVPIEAPHGRLTSTYGFRRSKRNGRRRFHAGVDFEAPKGVPVKSVRPGVVEAVPLNRERNTPYAGYGNAVVVRHEDEGVWVLYAHLQSVAVRPGDRVAAGQLLGTTGRTTNRKFPQMGPHLHLEVRVATPEGDSPFPGHYRRYNVNPRCWLLRHGLYRGEDGEPGPRSSAPLSRCEQ